MYKRQPPPLVRLAALLAGCGERAQTAFASHRKDDAPAYTGAPGDPFMAKNLSLIHI
nr:hypothetical protein [Ralstonia sp. ASV6]